MQTTLLYFIGAFSLLCLFGIIYILIISPANRKLLAPVKDSLPPNRKILGGIDIIEAGVQYSVYENSVTFYKKALISSYRIEEFVEYVKAFDNYAGGVSPQVPTPPIPTDSSKNYEWKISSSPMFILDNDNNVRLIVCILPTLVDPTNSKNAYNFFEEQRKKSVIYEDYFLALNDQFVKNTKFSSCVYDEGHLYP